MYVCETVLITVIAILGYHVVSTDLQYGLIKNKSLAVAMLIGAVVNLIYYVCFSREFARLYLINFFVMCLFSVAMYVSHFWAAGDSKLLICVMFLFPARFYDNRSIVYIPGVVIVVLIFLIAYLCIITDTIVQWKKGEIFYTDKRMAFGQVKQFLCNFLIGFLYLRGLSSLCSYFLGIFYKENQALFAFVNVFIALIIHKYPIFKKWYSIITFLILDLVMLKGAGINQFEIRTYLVLLAAFVVRYFASGYNYKEILVDDVKEGMVLSYQTVLGFSASRVKGLPRQTTEDISSRISFEQAEAIKRWKNSKKGKDKITIVRKVPFAMFIMVGTAVYFLIKVLR